MRFLLGNGCYSAIIRSIPAPCLERGRYTGAMATYRLKQVDVFTSEPFLGNPVAVVVGAEGIADEKMQQIAAWTNLSETTFLLPPTSSDADYLLRIFTPKRELPFAGHPTVGSAHAALESGMVDADATSLRMECGAGVLSLTVEGTGPERRIFVRTPQPKIAAEHGAAVESLSAALGAAVLDGHPPLAFDVGPVWLIVRMDAADLRTLRPDLSAVAKLSGELGVVGITAFGLQPGEEAAVRVRSFVPAAGINEDPVCGSGNAAVGAYLAASGLLQDVGPEYVATQGREIGRDGRVHVRIGDEGRAVEIGGCAVTVIEGEIRL